MEIQKTNSCKQTISLYEALIQCQKQERNFLYNDNDYNFFDTFVKHVKSSDKLVSMPITKYLARGSSAVTFETPNGDVLKLTIGNHFPFRRPIESFDVPIYETGKVGRLHYYIEEKLYQHGLSEGFTDTVIDKIKECGYKTKDFNKYDFHQIGFSKDGNLYLLDPECATYKSIFHAIYNKVKLNLKNLRKI